jgi:hypothetical protein
MQHRFLITPFTGPIGKGHDFEKPGDSPLRPLANIGVGGQCNKRGQSFEVYWKIRSRIPLGHLMLLKMVEPAEETLPAHCALLAPETAGPPKKGLGKRRAGQIAGSVEE